MKQTILIFAAMFILMIISANSVQAQTVILWINGQAMSYPANTPVTVPGVGTITASQAMPYYPQPQQQPQTLPASTTNNYNDQLSQANNQLALENKALQNEALKEQIRTSKTQRGLNIAGTFVNGLAVGFQTYNNTRVSGSTVNLLNSQSNYLNGMTGCCGNNGQTVTTPMPGGNPVFNPPGGTIWYDNNDGKGTFYMLNGYRVYTVAPPGSVINGQYAGQTPTINGWSNPNFGNQQGSYVGQSIGGTPNFGGNFNPYTNSMPAGYEYGVRTH